MERGEWIWERRVGEVAGGSPRRRPYPLGAAPARWVRWGRAPVQARAVEQSTGREHDKDGGAGRLQWAAAQVGQGLSLSPLYFSFSFTDI